MKTGPSDRMAVDLSAYPDLVVIYLGMRVRSLRGLMTLLGIGPKIDQAGAEQPPGLLHHENNIVFSFFPLQVGMRWYWKDFDSMEAWTRSGAHREWWKTFVRDTRGTDMWHETYFMRGGMEAIYSNATGRRSGLQTFAPQVPAVGGMYAARRRAGLRGPLPPPPEGVSSPGVTRPESVHA